MCKIFKKDQGVLGLNLSTSTTTKLQICNIYLAFQNMSDLFQALFWIAWKLLLGRWSFQTGDENDESLKAWYPNRPT